MKNYIAIGVDKGNRKFSIKSSNYYFITMLNLWKGNIWEINETGKKKLIKRVNN